ncbi:MAG: hypothetical protein DI576_00990 [Actinomyces sp.]|nr:MAG: hypothetical protein DI576_00990 [Actinomyces sp.]
MIDSGGAGCARSGWPRRRSAPPSPRSVHFRVEIGRVPARDRSSSGSRSVRFRVEIGSRSLPAILVAPESAVSMAGSGAGGCPSE